MPPLGGFVIHGRKGMGGELHAVSSDLFADYPLCLLLYLLHAVNDILPDGSIHSPGDTALIGDPDPVTAKFPHTVTDLSLIHI